MSIDIHYILVYYITINREQKKQTTGTARTTQHNEDIRNGSRLIEKF
nr:MAG TPA: hypothetical protein [Caudoviricetes sp.]